MNTDNNLPKQHAGHLTPEIMERLLLERTHALQGLESSLSKKMRYKIEAKIEQERTLCKRILDIQDTNAETQSYFSSILDSHYFEQKLFPPQITDLH